MRWNWSCPTVKSRPRGREKSGHRFSHHHHHHAQARTSPRSLRTIVPRILRLKASQSPRSLRARTPRILRLKPRTKKESTQADSYRRFLKALSCRNNLQIQRSSRWRKMDQITSWGVDGVGLRMSRKRCSKGDAKADITLYNPNSEEKYYDVIDTWAICPKNSWPECWQMLAQSRR